ncbi:sulfite exporter TauE/SafE family protein [Achromobacter sp. 77]|uniref:sulfite exporter TauE/SafE family protein n=1 Tax=Achromobacter TaxID=222 RepID=UPI001D01DB46|nr:MULTISPECIES: sulfite exporter TauE/SafE family protein [Achromobacter]MCU6619534.1 sulfite exporter TauE/SafE family protein [Achromobacter mucicolens]UDG76078.1 sulfite exporter TauE/SafE family protein [Achromobacter sp. 77]
MLSSLSFPDAWHYAAMAAVVFGAAVAQGVGGVGFAMFAAPVAAMFFPQLAPGPLLTLGGFISLLTALRERAAIDWPAVSYALAGRAVGTLIAIYAMARFAPQALGVLFACMILAAVGLSVAGLRFSATPGRVSGAGVASGIMGTMTSVGAPPIAIVLQHAAPPRLRATLGMVLFLGSIFSLAMLALAKRYTGYHVGLALSLAPFLLAGFAVSNRLRTLLPPRAVRGVLLAACAMGAVGVLVKTFWVH